MMPPPEQPARKCILIVEDDPSVGEMLTTLLEIEGYDTARADSGVEAINLLAGIGAHESMRHRCSPDLMLLDLQLPAMDGVQMVRHLAHLNQRVPPIILVSAKRPEAVDAAALAIGAAGVLYKPFQIDDLLDQIRSILVSRQDVPPTPSAGAESRPAA